MEKNAQPPFLDPQKVKIILAEDNPVNQKVAQMMLNRCGFSVAAANNGIEVIKLLKKASWDLILMDIQMPELDGIRTTKIIRNPESDIPRKDIPIIAMTAQATPGDEQLCLDAGMDAYLSKPITCKGLVAIINKVLGVTHRTNS
ncbi:MAG: response regulator [Desulfobacterium sp.]|jgi:CheY-like chemotaxis protein|nr:response regulator [Desulfobacterium sp.]